jgi:hypothetical protein
MMEKRGVITKDTPTPESAEKHASDAQGLPADNVQGRLAEAVADAVVPAKCCGGQRCQTPPSPGR